jgi:hypothetical protein
MKKKDKAAFVVGLSFVFGSTAFAAFAVNTMGAIGLSW